MADNNFPSSLIKASWQPIGEGQGFAIFLNEKMAQTPFKKPLIVPNILLAQEIVKEFSGQEPRSAKALSPLNMPFLRIANTVIDGALTEGQALLEDMLRYLAGDMMLYRAASPKALCDRESLLWDPVIERLENKLGVNFPLSIGVMPQRQDFALIEKIQQYLRHRLEIYPPGERPYILVALHMITNLSHSLLLALSVLQQDIGFRELCDCAFLEQDWTRDQWGADHEAEASKANRIKDLKAAYDLIFMLTPNLGGGLAS